MTAQSIFQSLLIEKWEEGKRKNPKYSLRSLAQKLGVSPGSLSQIIKGKRNISAKLALKLGKKLSLNALQWEKLVNSFETEKIKRQKNHQEIIEERQLRLDQYNLVSDWAYFALLNLIKTKDFQSNPKWMAQRLGLTESKIRNILEILSRIGFLVQDEKGHWKRSTPNLKTEEETGHLAVFKRHENNLEDAKNALSLPSAVRDFHATTFSLNSEKIPTAKKMIREFVQKLSAFMEEGETTEVYELNLQLIPRTKILTNKHQKQLMKEKQ